MENDYQWLHGRVDAGVEENFNLVESVPVKIPAREELEQRNLINVSREGTPLHSGVLSSLPGMEILFSYLIPDVTLETLASILTFLFSRSCHDRSKPAQLPVGFAT